SSATSSTSPPTSRAPIVAVVVHPQAHRRRRITMIKSSGYAAQNAKSPLGPFKFERRDPGKTDVQIDILYCGVCHTDIHMARNEWKNTIYPVVPGHEIVGRVANVGAGVTKFKKGDLVGVGCLVDSCGTCGPCRD